MPAIKSRCQSFCALSMPSHLRSEKNSSNLRYAMRAQLELLFQMSSWTISDYGRWISLVSVDKGTMAVKNMWGVLLQVSLFFSGSPKRQGKFEAVVNATPADLIDNSTKQKLVDLCRTRWVLRHTALITFRELFLAVCTTFEEISEDRSWNAETVSKVSNTLLTCMR